MYVLLLIVSLSVFFYCTAHLLWAVKEYKEIDNPNWPWPKAARASRLRP
jgi:nitrogen fixation-related uncharacterized protein